MDHVWGTVGGVMFYFFILLKAEDSVLVGHGSLNKGLLFQVCSDELDPRIYGYSRGDRLLCFITVNL